METGLLVNRFFRVSGFDVVKWSPRPTGVISITLFTVGKRYSITFSISPAR
jgi:hypothetical protein